jgi:HK97 gp10 family phage protein
MGFSTTEFYNRTGRYPGSRQVLGGGIGFDLAGFSAKVNAAKSRIQKAIRPTAQAGAEVIYEEAKFNAPQSEKAHFFYGTAAKAAAKGSKRAAAYGPFEPGTLARAIYQVYSKDNSGEYKATYHIAWNHKTAPYGFMVELGTSRAPAHPFLTRAINEARSRAAQAMKAEFISLIKQ